MRNPSKDGRNCPVCGGREFRRLHMWQADHPRNSATIDLAFWQCSCSLAFLHPLPTKHQMPSVQTLNQPYQSNHRRPQWRKVRAGVQNWVFGSPRRRIVRQTAKIQPHGRLVDVGAGTGELLAEAARIYEECVGIEPNPAAAVVAQRRGYEVVQRSLQTAAGELSSFEVATMDAVLEHLGDPIEAMTHVNQLLKVGGVVVVKVPKLFGPSHRHHGREWNGFRVGFHNYMFDGQVLTSVLEHCGFQVLQSPKRDRLLDDILILWGRKTHDLEQPQLAAA